MVSESFLPHVNGVTGSVVPVLRHLRRTGHEARVVAPGHPPSICEGADVLALPSVGLPGYPQVRVPLVVASMLAREFDRFQPDVVHLASPFVLGGPTVGAAASSGVPVVAVYQTDVAGFALRYGLSAASQVAWRRIRSIHERSALTLAPSATAAHDLEAHGVPRVKVWPRGVDTAAFSAGHCADSLRAQLAPNGEVLVGYVGRLAVESGWKISPCWADLPGVQLVIIGDGPERPRLARRLPGAVFTGTLRGAALSRAVASLDIAVHPGPYETFCQAAQESMASSVPVGAVGAGGLRDLVDSSRTGWLYAPGDLRALRVHVNDLAGDAAKRRAMGQAAHDAGPCPHLAGRMRPADPTLRGCPAHHVATRQSVRTWPRRRGDAVGPPRLAPHPRLAGTGDYHVVERTPPVTPCSRGKSQSYLIAPGDPSRPARRRRP